MAGLANDFAADAAARAAIEEFAQMGAGGVVAAVATPVVAAVGTAAVLAVPVLLVVGLVSLLTDGNAPPSE